MKIVKSCEKKLEGKDSKIYKRCVVPKNNKKMESRNF